MNEFLIYIIIVVIGGVDAKLNTSIPPFPNLNSCTEYVVSNKKYILDSAKSSFKNKEILELGCVVMENKDEIKFNPIYKMDKQV